MTRADRRTAMINDILLKCKVRNVAHNAGIV